MLLANRPWADVQCTAVQCRPKLHYLLPVCGTDGELWPHLRVKAHVIMHIGLGPLIKLATPATQKDQDPHCVFLRPKQGRYTTRGGSRPWLPPTQSPKHYSAKAEYIIKDTIDTGH